MCSCECVLFSKLTDGVLWNHFLDFLGSRACCLDLSCPLEMLLELSDASLSFLRARHDACLVTEVNDVIIERKQLLFAKESIQRASRDMSAATC